MVRRLASHGDASSSANEEAAGRILSRFGLRRTISHREGCLICPDWAGAVLDGSGTRPVTDVPPV